MEELVLHPLPPIFDKNSKIIILGTMPSPKSREQNFYYAHSQNRFWDVIAFIRGEKTPLSSEEKTAFLLRNNIALWDVIKSCKIKGASDASIKEPVANDINMIINKSNIKAVFTTGSKAYKLYNQLCLKQSAVPAICLPSTSPANCRFGIDKLKEEYLIINEYLKPLK